MWMISLLVSACAPPPYSPADTADTGSSASTDPAIAITWPAQEAEVTGCAMVVVEIENYHLSTPSMSDGAGQNVEGEGHYHLDYEGHYTPCGPAPFCLIGFAEGGPLEIVASLRQHDHTEVLDADGDPVTARLLLNVTAGECVAGTPNGYY